MKIYALQLKQKSTADVSNGIFRNFRTATLENMYFFLGGSGGGGWAPSQKKTEEEKEVQWPLWFQVFTFSWAVKY